MSLYIWLWGSVDCDFKFNLPIDRLNDILTILDYKVLSVKS